MAILWVEGFDIFGSSTALLGQAGYVDANVHLINNNVSLSRTGAGSMEIENGINGRILRRALNASVSTIGMGIGFMPLSSPTANRESLTNGLRFDSAGKTMEFMVVNQPNNAVCVVDRTGTVVGATPANMLTIGGFTHIEAKGIMNAGGVINTGSIEVHLNGQNSGSNKLLINGVNLPNQFAYGALGAGVGFNQTGDARFDDWIIWDNSTANNNDFLGDRRLFTSFMSADTAQADFTPVPGPTGFAELANNPANDAQYVEGTVAGNISDWQKTAIGIGSNSIAAVVPIARLFKSDAGVASARIGIHSGATVLNSAELFPGTTGSWFQFPIELDPNTGLPWTKANADAALARLTRVQ